MIKEYEIMSEERLQSSTVEISPNAYDNVLSVNQKSINIFLKVTDSDIRTIQLVPEEETVGSLKAKVWNIKAFSKELSENTRIRLINSGRIMLDSQSLGIYSKAYAELTDKAYIHAVLTPASQNDHKAQKKDLYRGFERLESSGFNVDDIHNLRFHFHAMCIYTGLNSEDDDQKYELEDKWLDGKIPAINANLNDRGEILLKNVRSIQDAETGDGIDLVWGIIAGILLSFLVCVIVRIIQIKKYTFNNQQKLGSKIGVFLSLVWVYVFYKLGTY